MFSGACASGNPEGDFGTNDLEGDGVDATTPEGLDLPANEERTLTPRDVENFELMAITLTGEPGKTVTINVNAPDGTNLESRPVSENSSILIIIIRVR